MYLFKFYLAHIIIVLEQTFHQCHPSFIVIDTSYLSVATVPIDIYTYRYIGRGHIQNGLRFPSLRCKSHRNIYENG